MTHKYSPVRRANQRRGRTERASCPPHAPILVDATKVGHYVASCLACGTSGPEREGSREAKAAFDEAHRLPAG